MALDGKWLFSKDKLANSPSRRCGIDADKELNYRQQAANFIQDMGQRLQVSQLCINTAIVYMRRFYMFHSLTRFHRNAIAIAALFLAAKIEEQPQKLEHFIKVSFMCLYQDAPPPETNSQQYFKHREDLLFNENVLLSTLGFDVVIEHPNIHVVRCCDLVKAGEDLAQASYFMASYTLQVTNMCLAYKPTVVACFCMHLACKWTNWEIPQSNEGKHWFWYVDKSVTRELLDQMIAEFLAIFDKCPSKLEHAIQTILVNMSSNVAHTSSATSSFHNNGHLSGGSCSQSRDPNRDRRISNYSSDGYQDSSTVHPPEKQLNGIYKPVNADQRHKQPPQKDGKPYAPSASRPPTREPELANIRHMEEKPLPIPRPRAEIIFEQFAAMMMKKSYRPPGYVQPSKPLPCVNSTESSHSVSDVGQSASACEKSPNAPVSASQASREPMSASSKSTQMMPVKNGSSSSAHNSSHNNIDDAKSEKRTDNSHASQSQSKQPLGSIFDPDKPLPLDLQRDPARLKQRPKQPSAFPSPNVQTSNQELTPQVKSRMSNSTSSSMQASTTSATKQQQQHRNSEGSSSIEIDVESTSSSSAQDSTMKNEETTLPTINPMTIHESFSPPKSAQSSSFLLQEPLPSIPKQSKQDSEHRSKSEKKKKEQKHKHKDKSKEKHKQKHKDRVKEKHRDKTNKEKDVNQTDDITGTSSSSGSLGAVPVKIKIPKYKLNLTSESIGTTSAIQSSSGLKIKIPKVRLKASESSATHQPATMSQAPPSIPQAPLKIKIRTDTLARGEVHSSFSFISQQDGGNRKREREAQGDVVPPAKKYQQQQQQRPNERQNGRHSSSYGSVSGNNKKRAESGGYHVYQQQYENLQAPAYSRHPHPPPSSHPYYNSNYPQQQAQPVFI